jgi:hypothetical protein
VANSPRLPKPMTPERAKVLSRRWLIAGLILIAVGTVLNAAGFGEVMPLPVVLGAFCLGQFFGHAGWRDGYLARVAQEKRAQAGEL